MGGETNKAFLELCGRAMIVHTLARFQECDAVDRITLVVAADDMAKMRELVDQYRISKVTDFVIGGRTRQESVYNGLKSMDGDTDIVLIHDGARPFVTTDLIVRCIADATEYGAATAAVPVKDTVKKVGEDGMIASTLDRNRLWLTQTPQSFRFELILEAHEWAIAHRVSATDDAMLAEMMGHRVKATMGDYRNIKITTPEDMVFARGLMCE